jgi:phosphohistidine phosphatase SixA
MVDQNENPRGRSSRQSRRSFLKGVCLCSGIWIATGAPFAVRGEPRANVSTPLSQLRSGGCVVFLRHAQTDRSRDDALRPDLKDCSTQRLLSPAGEKQADELGRVLRDLGVPVGQIFSSPYCRTVETARRALPGHRVTEVAELRRLGRTITNKVPESCARLKQLLAAKPPVGENTFIVGHSDNLAAVGGPDIEEAGMAIFRPEKDGFKLVGTLNPAQWKALGKPTQE